MPDHLTNTAAPITNTAAIKRVLRDAGLPIVTHKQWCREPGLRVTSDGLARVQVADPVAECETLAKAIESLKAAGAPVHEGDERYGFAVIY